MGLFPSADSVYMEIRINLNDIMIDKSRARTINPRETFSSPIHLHPLSFFLSCQKIKGLNFWKGRGGEIKCFFEDLRGSLVSLFFLPLPVYGTSVVCGVKI